MTSAARCCLALAAAVAAFAQARVEHDLVYARVGDRELRLDLHMPEAGERAPVVVAIHGGGWQSGSKSNAPGAFLVRYGYAVASVEYRLSGEAVFPAQIQDCKAALRWLRANASKYGLNPDRVAAIGSSAGGHLAALLGASGGVAELDTGEAGEGARIQAVVDLFGPADLARMGGLHDALDSPESRLLGGPILENLDKAERASPVAYIGRDDPPFLILHGDEDRTVPVEQSRILDSALRSKGVESTLRIIEGAGHGFPITAEVETAIVAFLDRHLKPPLRRDGWVDANLAEPLGTKYQRFHSPSAEGDVSYLIWLPPGYDQDTTRRYPVIYYLHGRDGTQRSGTTSNFVALVDVAVREGRMPPVIVVLPNGLGDAYWIDSFSGHEPIEGVMKELVRHVDRTYRTYAAPEARAIEGVSMGGFGAAHFGFKFPEWFAGMTSIAGALHDADGFQRYAAPPVWDEVFGANAEYANANAPLQLAERNAEAIRGRLEVRLVIGSQDSLLWMNSRLSLWLNTLGIGHEFTVIPGIGHSGSQIYATGAGVAEFYSRLFAAIAQRPAVSAASYRGPSVAPDSLVSVFGRDLATASVHVRDSAGVEHPARVLYASPLQVNFVMPALVADGPAEVRVANGAGVPSLFAAGIVPVAPGLFSGYYVNDGVLSLFGTGIRGRSSLGAVRATVGGSDCEVLYAGPQLQYAGLDQINVRLSGRTGEAEVVITVDGIASNSVVVRL